MQNSRLYTELLYIQRTKRCAGKTPAICSKNKTHIFTEKKPALLLDYKLLLNTALNLVNRRKLFIARK